MFRLSTDKDQFLTRKFFLIVFYFCASIMTLITAYALYISITEFIITGKVVVGEVLVNTEFPFKGLAKLVTYLMIVSVIGWYCVTRLGGDKVKGIPEYIKSILQITVLAICIVSLYEFLYNFIVWNSLITADAMRGIIRLDDINIPYPDPTTPWNLVFATKMSLSAFIISSHGLYLLTRKKKDGL